MVRRKGELSPAAVDSGWPYQVALPGEECRGTHFRTLRDFCIGLSLCPRGHGIFRDDRWWEVFCFADEAHAEAFRVRFGGERCDPAPRGRGRNWARWYKPAVE